VSLAIAAFTVASIALTPFAGAQNGQKPAASATSPSSDSNTSGAAKTAPSKLTYPEAKGKKGNALYFRDAAKGDKAFAPIFAETLLVLLLDIPFEHSRRVKRADKILLRAGSPRGQPAWGAGLATPRT
jgi:hypothetical protein